MKNIIKIFIISHLILLGWILLNIFIPLKLDENTYIGVQGILNPFTAFDSEHYLWIAEYGYTNNHLYAFFPLYPFLIKALNFLGISYALSGVFISWISSFFTSILVYKILEEKNKLKGLWIWGLTPIAIYTASVYTESLFVLLSLLSWYLFKKEKWLLSGIILGLTILTRNIGVFLAVTFILEGIIHRKQTKDLLKSLIPAGFIGGLYPVYLWINKGNPIYFATVQEEWNRNQALPYETILRDIQLLFNGSGYELAILINFTALLFSLFLSFKFWKKETGLVFFLLVGSIIPLFAPTTIENMPGTTSLFRYIFGLFPIYLLTAKLNIKGRSKLYGLAFYLFLMGTITILFTLKKFIG